MTTPTRPLPPGFSIGKIEHGWWIGKVNGYTCRVLLNTGRWTEPMSSWNGAGCFPTEAYATAAFWAWHDKQPENKGDASCGCTNQSQQRSQQSCHGAGHGDESTTQRLPQAATTASPCSDAQPENQPKGEVRREPPGYIDGVLDGMDLCKPIITSLAEKKKELTARVAALEAKDQPKPSPGPRLIEGMNQLRDAVRNGTLDQLPTTVVARCGDRTVRYTREPKATPLPSPSAEPSHREPVVGMVYMWKRLPTHEQVRICPDGVVEFCAIQWRRSGFTHHDIAQLVASGELVPVPGYKVEVTP